MEPPARSSLSGWADADGDQHRSLPGSPTSSQTRRSLKEAEDETGAVQGDTEQLQPQVSGDNQQPGHQDSQPQQPNTSGTAAQAAPVSSDPQSRGDVESGTQQVHEGSAPSGHDGAGMEHSQLSVLTSHAYDSDRGGSPEPVDHAAHAAAAPGSPALSYPGTETPESVLPATAATPHAPEAGVSPTVEGARTETPPLESVTQVSALNLPAGAAWPPGGDLPEDVRPGTGMLGSSQSSQRPGTSAARNSASSGAGGAAAGASQGQADTAGPLALQSPVGKAGGSMGAGRVDGGPSGRQYKEPPALKPSSNTSSRASSAHGATTQLAPSASSPVPHVAVKPAAAGGPSSHFAAARFSTPPSGKTGGAAAATAGGLGIFGRHSHGPPATTGLVSKKSGGSPAPGGPLSERVSRGSSRVMSEDDEFRPDSRGLMPDQAAQMMELLNRPPTGDMSPLPPSKLGRSSHPPGGAHGHGHPSQHHPHHQGRPLQVPAQRTMRVHTLGLQDLQDPVVRPQDVKKTHQVATGAGRGHQQHHHPDPSSHASSSSTPQSHQAQPGAQLKSTPFAAAHKLPPPKHLVHHTSPSPGPTPSPQPHQPLAETHSGALAGGGASLKPAGASQGAVAGKGRTGPSPVPPAQAGHHASAGAPQEQALYTQAAGQRRHANSAAAEVNKSLMTDEEMLAMMAPSPPESPRESDAGAKSPRNSGGGDRRASLLARGGVGNTSGRPAVLQRVSSISGRPSSTGEAPNARAFGPSGAGGGGSFKDRPPAPLGHAPSLSRQYSTTGGSSVTRRGRGHSPSSAGALGDLGLPSSLTPVPIYAADGGVLVPPGEGDGDEEPSSPKSTAALDDHPLVPRGLEDKDLQVPLHLLQEEEEPPASLSRTASGRGTMRSGSMLARQASTLTPRMGAAQAPVLVRQASSMAPRVPSTNGAAAANAAAAVAAAPQPAAPAPGVPSSGRSSAARSLTSSTPVSPRASVPAPPPPVTTTATVTVALPATAAAAEEEPPTVKVSSPRQPRFSIIGDSPVAGAPAQVAVAAKEAGGPGDSPGIGELARLGGGGPPSGATPPAKAQRGMPVMPFAEQKDAEGGRGRSRGSAGSKAAGGDGSSSPQRKPLHPPRLNKNVQIAQQPGAAAGGGGVSSSPGGLKEESSFMRAPSGLRRLDTTVTMMTSAWSALDGYGDSEWFRLLGPNKPQMVSGGGKDGRRQTSGPHQLGGGGVMPTLGDGEQATALLMEAVNVRSVHRGEGGATHLDHMMGGPQGTRRRKRAGPGVINFKAMRGVPASINAGVSGLSVEKAREGLARRMLAAQQNMYGPPLVKRKYIPRPETPEGVMMDGFMLLAAGDDDMPDGITAARLSSANISSLEEADLPYFGSLRVLDLSDNRVPGLSPLSALPALQALSLSLNRLTHPGPIDPAIDFQALVTLDLSYNQLEVEPVLGQSAPLGHLPRLAELNLSGNSWRRIPTTLAPFTALELLKLSENSLSGSALAPLSALPRLHSLSLSRNKHLEGLPGITGGERSAEEALVGAGINPGTAFPALEVLDLSDCGVRSPLTVDPLRVLPRLRRLLLAGNPLAAAAIQALRRDAQRRETASLMAADGAVLEPGALQPPPSDPLMVWEPAQPLGPKPSVGRVLTGEGGHLVTVSEAPLRRAAERAATLAAIAAVPEEAVTEAFDRADHAIEAWQLNTVPEEGEEDEEDGEPVEDHTFLTGIGITEPRRKGKGEDERDPTPPPPPAEDDRPLWQDVEDPTERLALALGLDPRRLAVHTGVPTTDAAGAVSSLRFALTHPLVEADEGMGPAAHHQELTEAARAKRRPRAGIKLAPLEGVAGSIQVAPDLRTIKIQTVEGMLEGMRARLAALEDTLRAKLGTSSPSGAKPGAPGKQQGGGKDGQQQQRTRTPDSMRLESEEEEEDEEPPPEAVESPKRATSPQPRQLGLGLDERDDDDNVSDMSALPEDVRDAIENSDPGASDSEDDYGWMEEEIAANQAAMQQQQQVRMAVEEDAPDGDGSSNAEPPSPSRRKPGSQQQLRRQSSGHGGAGGAHRRQPSFRRQPSAGNRRGSSTGGAGSALGTRTSGQLGSTGGGAPRRSPSSRGTLGQRLSSQTQLLQPSGGSSTSTAVH